MHGMGAMGKVMRAVGLMSGTSMDGIDVAIIETDGRDALVRGPSLTYPYSPAFRAQLREAAADAGAIRRRRERPGRLKMVEQYLTDLHAEAVAHFLEDARLDRGAVDVIGFHGHTVLHRPDARLTVQLGDGERLAALTGIDVVYDLRAADCAAGGEGAPLVPAYHRALIARLPDRPVAFLNVGGVANVTWIGDEDALLAFDTGPGNAMVDDWMRMRRGETHDAEGALAATGRVHEDYVTEYLRHSHFAAPPPKSLDRNAFPIELLAELSDEDGAATLTALAAAAIARAREHMPAEPRLWIVSGGGRKNRTLMGMLAERVENAVVPAEAVGLNGDGLEAEAWAYLAVRSLKDLPITWPGTTGVSVPMTGGLLARTRSG
jgi:anhydro-N-acetylmuramic acid kinase